MSPVDATIQRAPRGAGDAADSAYHAILDLILRGEVKAGDRLREEALAQLTGVSRTPVRQALSRLSTEGVVDLSRHRGAQVSTLTPQDSQLLLELRARLEPEATRLAVPRLSEEDLSLLADLAGQMEDLLAAPELPLQQMSSLNNAFHGVFHQRCGNRFLTTALQSVAMPAMVARTFEQYTPASLRRSMQHHAEILDAALARDAEWAEAAMRVHILAARHAYAQRAAHEEEAAHGAGDATPSAADATASEQGSAHTEPDPEELDDAELDHNRLDNNEWDHDTDRRCTDDG